MSLWLAVLVVVLYAVDEWLSIRRVVGIQGASRRQRVLRCGLYGVALAAGLYLVVEDRRYALLIPVGAMLGAWPNPRP